MKHLARSLSYGSPLSLLLLGACASNSPQASADLKSSPLPPPALRSPASATRDAAEPLMVVEPGAIASASPFVSAQPERKPDSTEPAEILPPTETSTITAEPPTGDAAAEAGGQDADRKKGYSWDVPTVARQPFRTEGGVTLNSFFFVRRRGESWENLSFMLYGTTARADALKSWNGDKPLKVGTVLYYNSARREKDTAKMLPIATDFNQAFWTAKAESGEALTIFSKRVYGEWRTWKEIAYFNSIPNPHNFDNHKALLLQPEKLGFFSDALRPTEPMRVPASQ